MKRSLFVFCLMMACLGAMAQKSYVEMSIYSSRETLLKGHIPDDMQERYYIPSYEDSGVTYMDVLNMLAERGYEIEFAEHLYSKSSTPAIILLSKKSSGPASAISRAKSDDGEEAYEVARYNLQGVPVSKNEKGVQIIVYSNYTTKTVIVE